MSQPIQDAIAELQQNYIRKYIDDDLELTISGTLEIIELSIQNNKHLSQRVKSLLNIAYKTSANEIQQAIIKKVNSLTNQQ